MNSVISLLHGIPLTVRTTRPYKTEVDRFGFTGILKHLTGYHLPNRAYCNWMHGWHFFHRNSDIHDVGYGSATLYEKTLPTVTYNTSLSILLNSHGFKNVFLGPLPFALLHEYRAQFFSSDALKIFSDKPVKYLLMPGKISCSDISDPDSPIIDATPTILFLQEALDSVRNSNDLLICLYNKDIHIPVIKDFLNKYRLNCIEGASPGSHSALLRIYAALSSAQIVYSNTIGSCLPYAGLVGASVGISGPSFTSSLPVHSSSTYNIYNWHQYDNIRYVLQHYPHLLKDSIDACQPCSEWARLELGSHYPLSASSIKSIAGWSSYQILPSLGRNILHRAFSRFSVNA